MTRLAVVVVLAASAAGCPNKASERAAPAAPGSGSGSGSARTPGDPLPALPPAPPVPTPATALPPRPAAAPEVTADQVALGELLFFDERLAATAALSCATCHDPDHDYAGGPGAQGADGKPNLRRVPSLTDVAWRRSLGWDGRSTTLERHLFFHFRGQLGADPADAIARIAGLAAYRAHFQRAFGAAPDGALAIRALVAYASTRYSPAAPWDQAEHGTAPAAGATGTPEVRGYLLFTGKAQCATCHVPPLYTDDDFHRLGLIASPDEGRGAVEPARRGAFKTPMLRGAARRVAFFHDGSATSLDAAIDWHLAGGTAQGADPSIVDLPAVVLAPAERADLGAFVRALSAAAAPPYPRPALPR